MRRLLFQEYLFDELFCIHDVYVHQQRLEDLKCPKASMNKKNIRKSLKKVVQLS